MSEIQYSQSLGEPDLVEPIVDPGFDGSRYSQDNSNGASKLVYEG
jgi:hypothetical protein